MAKGARVLFTMKGELVATETVGVREILRKLDETVADLEKLEGRVDVDIKVPSMARMRGSDG